MITKYDTFAAVLFLKFIAAEKGERPDLSLAVRSIPGQPKGNILSAYSTSNMMATK